MKNNKKFSVSQGKKKKAEDGPLGHKKGAGAGISEGKME